MSTDRTHRDSQSCYEIEKEREGEREREREMERGREGEREEKEERERKRDVSLPRDNNRDNSYEDGESCSRQSHVEHTCVRLIPANSRGLTSTYGHNVHDPEQVQHGDEADERNHGAY